MRPTLSSIVSLSLLVAVPSAALADGGTAPQAEWSPSGGGQLGAPAASIPFGSVPDSGGYVAPRFVPYLGGDIPKGAHIETRPDMAYVATGVSVLGSAYITSLIYGLSTCSAQMKCRPGSGWLYLPLAGPFITSAQSPTTGGQALAAFDGGVQVLGLALTIVGFAAPRKYVTWQRKSTTVSWAPTVSGFGPSSEGRSGASAGLSVTVTHL
jgi:hypothetical protein